MNYVVSVYTYGGAVKHYEYTNLKKAVSFAWQKYRFLRSQCDKGDYGQMHVTVTRTALADDYGIINECVRYYSA